MPRITVFWDLYWAVFRGNAILSIQDYIILLGMVFYMSKLGGLTPPAAVEGLVSPTNRSALNAVPLLEAPSEKPCAPLCLQNPLPLIQTPTKEVSSG